jgi:hypothetical protein
MDDMRKMRWWTVFACALLMALISVFNQVKENGLSWQEEHYRAQLEAVVNETAPNPAQYRILSDHLTVWTYRTLETIGVPRPIGVTFVLIRLAQNTLLFLLAALYWERLGLSRFLAILGIAALGWGMTLANAGTDLAINAHTEVILYTLAAWAALSEKLKWLIPITLIAALNRETALLIPLLFYASPACCSEDAAVRTRVHRRALLALAAYLLPFMALHAYYGIRPWEGPTPGPNLLFNNLTTLQTWTYFVATLSIIPVLAITSYNTVHPFVQRAAWLIALPWFIAHLCCSDLPTTRMFLLPQTLVFIPAMLFGIAHWRKVAERGAP